MLVEAPGFNLFSSSMDQTTFYSDLVVKVNVISVAKLMENILKDDPRTVSLQLDGWIANHYGYAGLLINDVTPHWCVFLLFSRKNLGGCSFPLFSSDFSSFRQCIMQI